MTTATLPAALTLDCDVALETACHEALVRQAYKDSVDTWTWCVGMTDATGHRVERYIDNPQPLEHCMKIYAWALDNYADRVRKAFKGCQLTKAQFAAALSFDWNTGAIDRASWVKHFRAGNIAAARKAIMNWTTPKSLTDRRKAERALFFDGKWSNDGTMIEYTRVTSRHTPDWGSAMRINVHDALRRALAVIEEPVIDQAPKPDNVPATPTLTPDKAADAAPSPPEPPVSAHKPAPTVPIPGKTESPSAGKRGGIAAALAFFLAGIAALWAWAAGMICAIPFISNLCN